MQTVFFTTLSKFVKHVHKFPQRLFHNLKHSSTKWMLTEKSNLSFLSLLCWSCFTWKKNIDEWSPHLKWIADSPPRLRDPFVCSCCKLAICWDYSFRCPISMLEALGKAKTIWPHWHFPHIPNDPLCCASASFDAIALRSWSNRKRNQSQLEFI